MEIIMHMDAAFISSRNLRLLTNITAERETMILTRTKIYEPRS